MRRIVLVFAIGCIAGCGGQQIAAGPVIGYVRGRGFSAGWEAGGGPMHTKSSYQLQVETYELFLRASGGMSWRPGPVGSAEHERITYLAWEPWFVVGGTMGLYHSSASAKVGGLVGAWEAAPWVIGARGHAPVSDYTHCSPCYTVSLALGWRWSGASEFYLAPKLGILNGTLMPFPYQQDGQ
jgi:hypothetical protein